MVEAPVVREALSLYQPAPPPISAEMCLDDVVRYYGEEEKARRLGDGDQDWQWVHIRTAVNELVSSVKLASVRLRRQTKSANQGVVTRCMARHLLSWYDDVIDVARVGDEYDDVFIQAKNGHTVIRKQMEQTNFRWQEEPETVNALWAVPRFVMERLHSVRTQLGIDDHELFVYGMAWSLSTIKNRDWDRYNIETYFAPAAEHMRRMVEFRRIDINAFASKIKLDTKGCGRNLPDIEKW